MWSPLEQFNVIPLAVLHNRLGLDLTIFHIIIILVYILILLKILKEILKYNAKMIPNSWQFLLEKMYELILSIVKQQAGNRGFYYLPLVFTIFFIVLFSNLYSLLPLSFAFTSHIVNIFFLSSTLLLGLFIMGFANFGIQFLKLFVPEAPILLLLILIPIELFSYVLRAGSLAIRLSANMMAGHTLVFIISSFLLKLNNALLIVFFGVLLLIFTLELGVAFLQAYVITILFTIYLHDSIWLAEH